MLVEVKEKYISVIFVVDFVSTYPVVNVECIIVIFLLEFFKESF